MRLLVTEIGGLWQRSIRITPSPLSRNLANATCTTIAMTAQTANGSFVKIGDQARLADHVAMRVRRSTDVGLGEKVRA